MKPEKVAKKDLRYDINEESYKNGQSIEFYNIWSNYFCNFSMQLGEICGYQEDQVIYGILEINSY